MSNSPSASHPFPLNPGVSTFSLSKPVTNLQQQVPNFNADFSNASHRTNTTFGDIENILPKFGGATHENVDSSFNRLENFASSFELMER